MQSKSTIKIVCSMIFEKKLHKMVFSTNKYHVIVLTTKKNHAMKNHAMEILVR